MYFEVTDFEVQRCSSLAPLAKIASDVRSLIMAAFRTGAEVKVSNIS